MKTYNYVFFFFFFNDTATTEIYTLSLHDALPISLSSGDAFLINSASFGSSTLPIRTSNKERIGFQYGGIEWINVLKVDRESTRLKSSHPVISYAVFCL